MEPTKINNLLKMSHIKQRLKLFLINLFYRKISTRIAVVMLALASVPILFSGFLLINSSQKAIKSSVLNSRKLIIIRVAEEIKSFIRKPQDMLTNTASLFTIIDPKPWEQESILVELALNQPTFMQISSLDLSGRLIASSELGKQQDVVYPEEIRQDVSADKTYISQVKIFHNHTPYLTMAVPIKKMGKVTGILIADVNLRGIWNIVDNIRLDETGRAFLVSGDGMLIAHWDKKSVLRNQNLKDRKDVQSALMGKTEVMEFQGTDAKKWVSAFAPISDLGWAVVLRQEQHEAYLFLDFIKTQSWLVIILSEALIILLSIYLARALTKPIRLMTSGFKRVAGGDLGKIIEIKGHDEIGQLARYLNLMTEKLREAKDRERLSAIGEASAWITHEFKNSLASIKSFVQLFPAKHSEEKFVDTFSKLIPKEINRCENMLKELSEFSSFLELRPTQGNLSEIINNILKIMEDELRKKKIDVRTEMPDDDFYITVDPERISQVFVNLIINAIDAMPAGGMLSVSVDLIDMDNSGNYSKVQVEIKDTGEGVPGEVMEKIFEPFFTTKKGSMGLGLAISRRIIEQHGGKISVESRQNIGTTFTITLPVGTNYLQDRRL